MAVRLHTIIDSKNYYWSSFNPAKIFGTLQAAQNYERLYYVDEGFQFYIRLYREKDCCGDFIQYNYDPQLTYFYEPRVSGLQERETADPIFFETDDDKYNNDKSFFYFLDQAKSIEIKVNKDADDTLEEKGLNYSDRIKKMNRIIKTFNMYWKVGFPFTTGKFNYSKLRGWEKI